MEDLVKGFSEAIRMILSLDEAVTEIVLLSFQVSLAALILATLLGVPLGAAMGLSNFVGRRLATVLVYTGMGLPPVVVGLFVYLMLSRSGLLGQFNSPLIPTLFTPGAMVVAQTILALPLIAGFTMAAVMGVDHQMRQQIRSLGATSWQTAVAVLREARVGVVVAIIAGFGAIISEVGAVMMVGGNIEGRTRVLTTAIVLETSKGNFDLALALGIILLGIAFVINTAVLLVQGKGGGV